MQYIKEIFFILGKEKKRLPLVLFIILLGSFLDLLTLSIIAPFIILITDPKIIYEKYNDNIIFSKITNFYNGADLVLVVGILLIIIFLLRSALSVYLKFWILNYTLKLRVKIQSKLLKAYQKLIFSSLT